MAGMLGPAFERAATSGTAEMPANPPPSAPMPTPIIRSQPSANPFRQQATDAPAAHQRLLNDPKWYQARLGLQGYAQALADAENAWCAADLAYAKARGG